MTAASGPKRPIVLLGEFTGKRVARLQAHGWGRMFIQTRPRPYPREPYGLDNGAFRDWRKGAPFNHIRFTRMLHWTGALAESPYVCVLPDRVAEGDRSLAFSAHHYHNLPPFALRWPWYLALQDGMTAGSVMSFLRNVPVDGLFLGGTRDFKRHAAAWARLARMEGKRFHYGRCSTPRRLDHAVSVGADSIDTAFPMWTELRWTAFEAWWRGERVQLSLDM